MKQIAKRVLLLVLTAMLTLSCVAVYGEEPSFEATYFDMLLSSLVQNYKFDIDTESMAREFAEIILNEHPEKLPELIKIASGKMDMHSDYYTPEELESFMNAFRSEYVGIGVMIQRTIGAVEIVTVFPGSKAEAAGLRVGDRFLAVNGQDVTDFTVEELTQLIKGVPETTVELTVRRGEETLTMQAIRGAVNANTVSYYELEGGVGYMQIASFNGTTPSEVDKADEHFRGKRVKKLIIDLRDNPGGDMISVVHSLGAFVPRGKTVVSIEYARSERNTSLRSVGKVKQKPYYDKIVVLINENSASGAELFAGNIRDYQLGTLVGVTTFGKGTMQEFMNLPSIGGEPLGSIKLTTAEYILPSGEHINGKGIRPDYWEANRSIRFDDSDMEPLDFFKDYQEGDSGKGVLALKQRFSAVGYFVGELDETFDRELTISVKQFQKQANLPATGVVDYQTLRLFSQQLDQTKVLVDEQFAKAYELVLQTKEK